jgi:dipeptidyl aminopeptidase/acylaminoacyl peptidase
MQVHLKSFLLILAASLTCGAAIPAATDTQEAKPLAVEDALRIKQFGPLMPIALSPNGTRLAYTVQDNGRARAFDMGTYQRTGVPAWAAGTDIWVQNIESGAIRNLTDSKGDNWLPVWSRDGHYLAFLSTRDGADQARLWVWDATQDKLRELTDAKMQGDEIEWTTDSRHLLVTTPAGDSSRYDDVPKAPSNSDTGERPESAESGSTAILYLRDGVSDAAKRSSRSGPFNLDRQLRNLVSVDVGNGEISTLVHETRIMAYLLSPDGSRIAYTIPARLEKPGSQQILYDLAVVGIAGNQARILASEIPLDSNGDRFRWSPDSRRIAYRESGPGTYGDCYVAAVDGKSPQNVTRLSLETDVRSSAGSEEPLWDGQGKTIFFLRGGALWRADVSERSATKLAEIPGREIREMIPRSRNLLWTLDDGASTVVVTYDNSGKQDGFYKIDLRSGKSIRLLESGRCYTCVRASRKFTVADDGRRLVYFEEDAGHSPDLWTSDAGLQSVRRLTHLNPQLDKYEMGAAQLVRWLSDDGQSLQGTLLLPSDYKAGVRYPLIVWVYGGSLLSNDFDQFGLVTPGPFNMQLLATRGYAVLLPDMPLGVGTQMADIAKTVLPGVNKVIELGIADPAHLGVMGHSFGGYSTLSLIVQTTRFSAAIEASGFSDTVGDYGEMTKAGTAFAISTEEHGSGSMGGTPWDVRDRYIANSPVFFFDRVQTPLLIIHGAEDTTVAPYLGDEVFVDLRRLGKDVEYARYEGEGHSPVNWRYANQVDFCNRVIAWFDKYLK